ncbi:MAG: haloacid dehalogenase-like hydrolase, partial [Nanoarchaeota archaeon]
SQESTIQKNEIELRSDFDGTMIEKESIPLEVLAYFFWKPKNKFSFALEIIKEYEIYKKTGNIEKVYSLFRGCPVEILENITPKLYLNDRWIKLVERLGLQEMALVSRNIKSFITKFVREQSLPVKIGSIIANSPEIENGVYTGRVIPRVSNANLANLVKKGIYICGEDEKRILERAGLHPKKVKEKGLFIYEKR